MTARYNTKADTHTTRADKNKFDPATQGDSLASVLGKATIRRKKDKKGLFQWWGKTSGTLEDKLGGGVGGSAKSLGAHAATGAGIGGGLALLIPVLGPAVAPVAALIGAGVGTATYAIGKYNKPKEEKKSYYL